VRKLDMIAMLSRRHTSPFRFLVFENSIKREFGKLIPQALEFTDVLPHPTYPTEGNKLELSYPVRVGLIGQATEAKGITPFLYTAKQLKKLHGNRVEFHLIGRVFPGTDLSRFSHLDGTVSYNDLPRNEFHRQLSRMHYVFLPLQPEYYQKAASGAILDAVSWEKPIISTSLPIVADIFKEHGDIGYLCSDATEMSQVLGRILSTMENDRYKRQVISIARAHESRLPINLSNVMKRLFNSHYQDL
jgi:hypothetical protein